MKALWMRWVSTGGEEVNLEKTKRRTWVWNHDLFSRYICIYIVSFWMDCFSIFLEGKDDLTSARCFNQLSCFPIPWRQSRNIHALQKTSSYAFLPWMETVCYTIVPQQNEEPGWPFMLAEQLEWRFMATVVTNVIAKMRHRSVQVESDHDVTRFLWIPKTSQFRQL